MIRPWYAVNARDLLEARQQGQAPAGPVNVALAGRDFDGMTLHVRPDMPLERMDWRMLVDLQVWLWAGPSVALDKVLRAARDIAQARPAALLLRFEEPSFIHDVEIGTGTHRPAVLDLPPEHTFTWCPINLGGTGVGVKLRRALIAELPRWSTL